MPVALGHDDALSRDKKRMVRLTGLAALVLVAVIVAIKSVTWLTVRDPLRDPEFWRDKCQQPDALVPAGHFANTTQFFTEDYRNVSAQRLGGAVRIPTESYDDMHADPQQDHRFDVFAELHAYLRQQFPRAAAHLEVVNGYGLLYTLPGESHRLPSVFMAHQDVVPVERETANQWSHEPFSGFYDGERVWGRGSSDTKNSLVAILEAVEDLLSQHWVPQRDVVLAFGFDEELDGSRGAGPLADEIRRRYNNEVSMIVDEGSGVGSEFGSAFAVPGVGEKGYTDVEVVVHTPGGHSSIPPDHTGIGIASELVVQLETQHVSQRSGTVNADDTTAELFTCFAAHGSDASLSDKRTFVDPEALRDYLMQSRATQSLITTTQAIDVISGGVKINALPEQVSFTANYRIDVHESVDKITDGVQRQAEDVASRHGLGLVRNNRTIVEPTARGYVEITNGQSLEPSPISPHTPESGPWRLIAGTSRHVLETYFDVERLYMAPAVLGGNTDTVHYWGLTDSIYRYTLSIPTESGANAHTVDEWVSVDSHLATVAWYYELLQFV